MFRNQGVERMIIHRPSPRVKGTRKASAVANEAITVNRVSRWSGQESRTKEAVMVLIKRYLIARRS